VNGNALKDKLKNYLAELLTNGLANGF